MNANELVAENNRREEEANLVMDRFIKLSTAKDQSLSMFGHTTPRQVIALMQTMGFKRSNEEDWI